MELVTQVSKFAHLSHDSFGKWANFQDEFVCCDEELTSIFMYFPLKKARFQIVTTSVFLGGVPNQKVTPQLRGPRSLLDT